MTRRPPADWAMLLALVVLWGSTFALTKIAVETLTPVWLAALRLAIGASILVAVGVATGLRMPLDRRSLAWFALIGLSGTFLPFLLLSWAQQHIDSGLAGILLGLTPLTVLVVAHFGLADEKITLRRTLGLVAGFAGVALLFLPSLRDGPGTAAVELLAMAALLACCALFAVQSVAARRMPPQYSSLQKAIGSQAISAVVAVALALVVEPAWPAPSAASLLSLAALGIFSTALAGLVFYRLVDRAGPGFVTLSNYLLPVYAVGVGAALLGERLAPSAYAALVLVLAGILIAGRRR